MQLKHSPNQYKRRRAHYNYNVKDKLFFKQKFIHTFLKNGKKLIPIKILSFALDYVHQRTGLLSEDILLTVIDRLIVPIEIRSFIIPAKNPDEEDIDLFIPCPVTKRRCLFLLVKSIIKELSNIKTKSPLHIKLAKEFYAIISDRTDKSVLMQDREDTIRKAIENQHNEHYRW